MTLTSGANRRTRHQRQATRGVFLAALTLVVASCAQGVNIYDARISVDGTVVQIVVAACQANETVELDEGADKVVVLVRAHYESNAVDYDCADSIYFQLSEPLGGRPLIDASDGDEIEVRVSESVTSVP